MKNIRPKNKEELPASPKKRIKSKDKGNAYEQWLAKHFRSEHNFQFCKSSRWTSRILDDCGIDLNHLPYLIQAKSGYWKFRPKPDVIFKGIKENLEKNFPAEDPIHQKPMMLFHKLDGHKEEHHLVTMKFVDFIKILKVYEQVTKNSSL